MLRLASVIILLIAFATCYPTFGQKLMPLPTGEYELSNQNMPNELQYLIRFPGKPSDVSANKRGNANKVYHEYTYNEGDVAIFGFSINSEKIASISSNVYSDPKTALANIKAGTRQDLVSKRGKIIEEIDVNSGYYRYWVLYDQDNHIIGYTRSITCLKAGNLYSVIVSAADEKTVYSDKATKFLTSLDFPRKSVNDVQIAKKIIPPVAKWRKFIGPDQDFSLLAPNMMERLQDAQGERNYYRHFQCVFGYYSLAVIFYDYDGDPEAQENNVFGPNHEKLIRDGFIAGGYRVVQMRRIAPNIVEKEYWHPNIDETDYMHVYNRSILHKGRVYDLDCGYLLEGNEVDKKICRMFFDSFKLLSGTK
jgi:hypothetical protein